MSSSRASLGVLVAALGATSVGACTKVPTDASAIAAIQFDSTSLPFPAIVGGDSLRDSTGAVAPLHAAVFNVQGGVIADAPVQYITTDTLATVTADGKLFVRALRDTPIPVFAVVGSLQSVALNVPIVPAPETLAVSARAKSDTIVFAAGDTSSLRFSSDTAVAVQLRNVSLAGGTGVRVVPNWIVSFRIEYRGRTLEPTDRSVAYLVTSRGIASAMGKTDASGSVNRAVGVRRDAFTAPLDSVVVFATARYKGQPVPGSPLRQVVYIKR